MLTINKQRPDIERGINVGNDDFDVGAGDTRAWVIRVCQRRLDVNKSGKELIDCAHQRKNDGLRWLRPDGESADCTAFRAACRKSTVLIADAVVQVPRVDVQHVDKECSASHGGDR